MDALHPPISALHHQEILQKSAEQAELIERLLSIGTALSGSHDLEELLNLILSKSREITCSDAGSVYLVDRSDESPKLVFKTAQNDSIPAASFREFAMPLTPDSLAGYVAITGESLNISDAYDLPKAVPYQLDRNFDRDFSYRTRSVLVLPMQNQEGEITGVLQLINRRIQPDAVLTEDNTLLLTRAYSEWEETIVRSLASQAAISIERNQLQESIENLFEGFVKASIQVIEARDPTTYGHSERVAELTVCLGLEANEVSSGPLQSIYFSDRQIQEIRYAALLHDFGKIGVPEAILGKRKKLYPEQLDVIRHRFALAQRTLEMECAQHKFKYLIERPWHQIHTPAEESTCLHCQQFNDLEAKLQTHIQTLNRYWDLLLDLNEPEVLQTREFQALSEGALAELVTLAEYTYRDVDGQTKPLVTPDEMAQLMVPRGNLTPQERLAIEAHVTHSYEFLKRIPWTKHLKQVPIIAYGHHEKLDGSGYPRGLSQEQIPLQTQMMSIADIYDALAASDRPYKRRLPIDAVLKIIRAEASKNKINTDLVELFEQRQVYRVLGHSLPETQSVA